MSTATTSLPVGTWQVDGVHSALGFEVDYVAGTFRGTFNEFSGSLVVEEDGQAKLSGSAPVTGIAVPIPQLEGHLHSPEFFDVERAPELSFESDRVEVEGDSLRVHGRLTIRGAERPVELTGNVTEPVEHFTGTTMLYVQLRAAIDRTEYGLSWNQALPNGKMALGNEVRIQADLYLTPAS